MKKKMSTCEKFFREEGEVKGRAKGREEGRAEGEVKGRAEGTENTIRNFVERKRSRHVPEEQIHEELLLDFGLDATKALQYMESVLAKA